MDGCHICRDRLRHVTMTLGVFDDVTVAVDNRVSPCMAWEILLLWLLGHKARGCQASNPRAGVPAPVAAQGLDDQHPATMKSPTRRSYRLPVENLNAIGRVPPSPDVTGETAKILLDRRADWRWLSSLLERFW